MTTKKQRVPLEIISERHYPYMAGTPLRLARGMHDKFIDCVDDTIAVQMLRVNSQIYFEAFSILYSQTFAFADGKMLQDFIRKINTEVRPFIVNVGIARLHVATRAEFHMEDGVRYGYFSRAPNSTLNLTGLTGLKTLSIRLLNPQILNEARSFIYKNHCTSGTPGDFEHFLEQLDLSMSHL